GRNRVPNPATGKIAFETLRRIESTLREYGTRRRCRRYLGLSYTRRRGQALRRKRALLLPCSMIWVAAGTGTANGSNPRQFVACAPGQRSAPGNLDVWGRSTPDAAGLFPPTAGREPHLMAKRRG